MNKDFEIYESVRIKEKSVTGVIVAIDTDGGTKPPIYFVEVDDNFKTGEPEKDVIWLEADEIEPVAG